MGNSNVFCKYDGVIDVQVINWILDILEGISFGSLLRFGVNFGHQCYIHI